MIIFLSSGFLTYTPSGNLKAESPLIVFHMDFNSVSLRTDYIINWLNKAAEMGYNAVLWEIEDDIKWETCPECASPDAMSKNEFKKILEHSRKLGLEPIPLLQTIGHAEYVLQHEKYFNLREDPDRYDCYCTSNSDVKTFLKNWINEYLDLFGKVTYFHLGGDEAYAFATCEKCRVAADKIGKNKLYTNYLKEISDALIAKGIRPGIWSDMILKDPLDINALDKSFIIWDWNYWDGDSSPEAVMIWSEGKRLPKKEIPDLIYKDIPQILTQNGDLNPFYTSDFLKKNGFDVIICSSARSHGDGVFAGRNNIHISNIIGAARKTIESKLFGTCVTSWAVRVHNYETQEPWIYLAPLTIRNHTLKTEELLNLASKNLFKVENSDFFRAINNVGFAFPFGSEKSTGIMWTGLKDSKPAPEGYTARIISSWMKGGVWDSMKEKIRKSKDSISAGIHYLNKFIAYAESGKTVLNNWALAGYFQFWQSEIANDIADKVESNSKTADEEMYHLVKSLKSDYYCWAKKWMKEMSAEQNAGLVYDSFLDFYKPK